MKTPTKETRMETFTQPKITGYRQLVEEEVSLINRAKALDTAMQLLAVDIRAHVQAQWLTARPTIDEDLVAAERLNNAEPERWLAMGRASIQVGVMQLVRSIAQPAS